MSNEKDDALKKYMDEFIDSEVEELSKEDLEFEKYAKLYEEKFGKKAYIREPDGTVEQTISAIKICLEKNEDILDQLLYPNFDEDMKNNILY